MFTKFLLITLMVAGLIPLVESNQANTVDLQAAVAGAEIAEAAEVTIYEDRTFDFVTKLPHVSELIRQELKLKKGASETGREEVGTLSDAQLTKIAEEKVDPFSSLNIESNNYILATIHRSNNTDDLNRLSEIFSALDLIAKDRMPVILPMHPRTKKQFRLLGKEFNYITIVEPVSYFEMLLLEKHANIIMTDSGGVQKEAYWFNVPCLTIRNETEWVETIQAGCNTLVDAAYDSIVKAVENVKYRASTKGLYGDGHAAEHIAELLIQDAP